MSNEERDKAIAELSGRVAALEAKPDFEPRLKEVEAELAALRAALEPTGLPPKE